MKQKTWAVKIAKALELIQSTVNVARDRDGSKINGRVVAVQEQKKKKGGVGEFFAWSWPNTRLNLTFYFNFLNFNWLYEWINLLKIWRKKNLIEII